MACQCSHLSITCLRIPYATVTMYIVCPAYIRFHMTSNSQLGLPADIPPTPIYGVRDDILVTKLATSTGLILCPLHFVQNSHEERP